MLVLVLVLVPVPVPVLVLVLVLVLPFLLLQQSYQQECVSLTVPGSYPAHSIKEAHSHSLSDGMDAAVVLLPGACPSASRGPSHSSPKRSADPKAVSLSSCHSLCPPPSDPPSLPPPSLPLSPSPPPPPCSRPM